MRPLLLALILTSCTAIDANLEYMPPYTQDQLRQAEAFVDETVYFDWFELKEVCNFKSKASLYGCPHYKEVNGEVKADIYLFEGMSLSLNMNVYNHELGHIYEVLVLGEYDHYLDGDRSNDHEGWCVRGEFCYGGGE